MFVICAYGNVHMFDCVCLYVLTFVCIRWCMSKQMSGWVDICMQIKKRQAVANFQRCCEQMERDLEWECVREGRYRDRENIITSGSKNVHVSPSLIFATASGSQ